MAHPITTASKGKARDDPSPTPRRSSPYTPALSLQQTVPATVSSITASARAPQEEHVTHTSAPPETTAPGPSTTYTGPNYEPNVTPKWHVHWNNEGEVYYSHPNQLNFYSYPPPGYIPSEDSDEEPELARNLRVTRKEQEARERTTLGLGDEDPKWKPEFGRPRADTIDTNRTETTDDHVEGTAKPSPETHEPLLPEEDEDDMPSLTDEQLTQLVQSITDKLKPASTKIRVMAPKAFNGSWDRYDAFRRSLEQYVHGQPDEEKVITSLSYYSEGPASRWAKSYWEHNKKKIEDGTIKWEDFLRESDSHFKDTNRARKARTQIIQMKIDPKEPLSKFFVLFSDLRREADMEASAHDPFLISYLEKIIPKAITQQIQMAFIQAKNNKLDKLEEELKAGEVKDAEERRRKIENEEISYETFRRRAEEADRIIRPELYKGEELLSRRNYAPKESSYEERFPNDTPMDVDDWNNQLRRLSNEDKERYLREGRCFACGIKGHRSNDPRHDKERKEYLEKKKKRQEANSTNWRDKNKGQYSNKKESLRLAQERHNDVLKGLYEYMKKEEANLRRLMSDDNEDTEEEDPKEDF